MTAPSNPASRAELRRIPSVERVLSREDFIPLEHRYGRAALLAATRTTLDLLRADVLRGLSGESLEKELASLSDHVRSRLAAELTPSLVATVNATGVIVHTNLGRAPLSRSAIEAIERVASGYSNLELDLSSGKRGSRHQHASRLLARLFPGQAALVVNNAAAAVMLSLNTFAAGGEVVISRGELVEIGGSFRVPDILERSGAKLREVGTTNKTRLSDYDDAIGPETRVLLRVHPSNFRIVGFTEAASTEELAALGKQRGLVVIEDFGSGNLVSLASFGLLDEPTVAQSLASGVDVTIFSGDKLLGGPQAGILVGEPDRIRAMKDNPMARALRVDKLTYAALEATLTAFVREKATEEIPVLSMLAASADDILARARSLLKGLDVSEELTLTVKEATSRVGGGAAPDAELPTHVIAVRSDARSPEEILRALREHTPPVIARITDDEVLLDLRTVLPEQEMDVKAALKGLA